MEENTSDSTSIFYEVSQENNNIFFNTENITIRGFANFKDGIFTGKYQDLQGNNIEFTMSRDSLFTNKVKEFIIEYDTIIPSIWTPNKATEIYQIHIHTNYI